MLRVISHLGANLHMEERFTYNIINISITLVYYWMSDRDEMANNIRGPEIYNYRFFSENYPAFSQNIWMTGWNILFIMDHFCSEACYITWRPYLMSKPTKGFHDHIDHSFCSNSKTAVSVKIINDLLDVRSTRNTETSCPYQNKPKHENPVSIRSSLLDFQSCL
jgi:hypothetical protein